MNYLKFLIILFIYLWLCWVFVAAWASLVAASEGCSLAGVLRLLSAVALFLLSTGSRAQGLQ